MTNIAHKQHYIAWLAHFGICQQTLYKCHMCLTARAKHSHLSRNAWKYIMALTLTGVRHLISPRWLEKM